MQLNAVIFDLNGVFILSPYLKDRCNLYTPLPNNRNLLKYKYHEKHCELDTNL